ncbi:MAG: sulfatase-like hydrolase/transferase, partial [Planctomycetota bacterium]
AGLMSGRYQNRFGVESNGAPLDGFNAEWTIAERLKEAGYATGMTGKWHLGPANQITDHGFGLVYYQGGANWTNFDLHGKDVKPGTAGPTMYHLEANAAAAVAFINRYRDRPFFFYLAYRAPHVPLDATEKYLARFPGPMPERRRKALAMISAMDDGVGLIMQALRQHDIEDNTLIFFIGDNGAPLKIHKYDAPGGGAGWDGSLNDPMNGEKGMLSEGGIRVPFVAYWKNTLPAGRVYEQPVISLDVAATALSLAGLPDDPKLDGVNVIPYLRGNNRAAPHDLLYWRWIAQSAVRQDRWKYLRGGDREYLFDLATDAKEEHNVLAAHPDIAARLKAKLETWSNQLNPPGLAAGNMSTAATAYFDYYLDGKPAPPRAATSEPTPARGKAKTRPDRDPAAIFKLRDQNNDGLLTLEELIGDPENRNVPALTKRFNSLDRNEDDKLTLAEFAGEASK